jgi:hypothetical protein
MPAPNPNSVIAVLPCGPTADAWPIEIAWRRGGEVRSMLIRPASDWLLTSWDKGFETRHRLPLERLLSEGKSPLDACLVLNAAIGGETVGVGSPQTDCVWLFKLYKAAEVTPNFRLIGVEGVPPAGRILRARDMAMALPLGEPQGQTA